MYENYFGFKEKPFNVTPDTKFFFPSEKHEEALNSLIYAIKDRKGFAVITGEIGSGKTTVWHTLLSKLDTSTKVATITNTHLTSKQIIIAILEEFEIPYKDKWLKIKLLNTLNHFLIEQISLDFNVVVVIDEAQNLSFTALEEVRMLSNLETEKEKLIQIILMGQPSLRQILARRELEQLRQRIAVFYHIEPLSIEETKNYIHHRLRIVGADSNLIFYGKSAERIHYHTGGIPRWINTFCDKTLLTAFTKDRLYVCEDFVEEVAREVNEIGQIIPDRPKEMAIE